MRRNSSGRQGARPLDAPRRVSRPRGVSPHDLHRSADAMLPRAQQEQHRRPAAAARRHRELLALARRRAGIARAEGLDPGRPDGDRALSWSGPTRGPGRQELRQAPGHRAPAASFRPEPLAQRASQQREIESSTCIDRRLALEYRQEEERMRYLLVYYGGSMPDTPAQQARVMKQSTTWSTNVESAAV